MVDSLALSSFISFVSSRQVLVMVRMLCFCTAVESAGEESFVQLKVKKRKAAVVSSSDEHSDHEATGQ